jgi:histidinol-phosphatase
MPGQFETELNFALEISRAVSSIALNYFDQGVEVEAKSDGTPVTLADKEVERLIRTSISASFPEDGILGEEEGEIRRSNRTWIVDPIDGTYNFARGIPIWSTLLALEVDGEIVMGVVNAPAMKECFWANKGGGTFKNGHQIRVSSIDSLSRAALNFGSPERIYKLGKWDAFTQAILATERQRGFGDYLGFSLVLEGKSEAMLETGVKAWDLAPMKILVEEAGGCFFDLDGGDSIYPGSCLVTNKLLALEFKRIFVK